MPQAPAVTESWSEFPRAGVLPDDDFQGRLLQGVSRTFALTIPQLPAPLMRPVSNAYLLCRVVDTIEDEPALDPASKRDLCRRFSAVVEGRLPPEPLARALTPRLSDQTLAAERALVRCLPRVIAIHRGLTPTQQAALRDCVGAMSEGMAEFQQRQDGRGLTDLAQLDRYCYYVAGVVGEMLTTLFCDYSPEIAARREPLMRLAASFGQGLQMTNILKDIWDDHRRGVCWLPRDVFAESGFDLGRLRPGCHQAGFDRGLARLIGIAHRHLRDALTYTLLIPRHEAGLRRFCLWALGLAVLTLRRINRHRDFVETREVKISRHSVRATVLASRLTAGYDPLLRSIFRLSSVGLPRAADR